MSELSLLSKEGNPFALSVREGLLKPVQRELSFTYFYDDLGTALFEAITLLPEYGLAQADLRLIQNHAAEILNHLESPVVPVELGSGTGEKTRRLLKALSSRQIRTTYFPIDVSFQALDKCGKALSDLPGIRVHGLHTTYLEGLRQVAARRAKGETLLTLFVGSSIGNFSREEAKSFLQEIGKALKSGDGLLIGFDLIKPIETMLLAYDDPTGVTAAFNKNLLARINRELQGNFQLEKFDHEARYNETEQQIEMHLRAKVDQNIVIHDADLDLMLKAGETIRTEVCRKFTLEDISRMAVECGFSQQAQWVDEAWPFCESLWFAV